MTQRQYLMLQRVDFATTADRVAFTWLVSDIGSQVYDIESGQLYVVRMAGTGSTTMSPLTPAGGQRRVPGLSIDKLRLVTSGNDVGNIAAIGGLGAADTAPIYRGDAANTFEWSWAAAAVGALGFQISLPEWFDGSQDVTLELDVNSGTTDAATIAVATCWDGGTEVADSASDAATKSATTHTITATIDKADVPDSPKELSVRLTPPAHGTNAIQLRGVRLKAYAK